MGSAASADKKCRLQNADRAELLNIVQDLSEEHRQLLLKALEVTKEVKESASKDAHEGKEIKASASDAHGEKEELQRLKEEIKEDANAEQKEKLRHLEEEMKDDAHEQQEDLPERRQLKSLDVEDTEEMGKDAEEQQVEKEDSKITETSNLRDFFEQHYRQGGRFEHRDYEQVPDADLHTWMHRPTGIRVWRDAIDLTRGEGGKVYFHYTSELAFQNITAPSKKAAEVWASLNSDPGPKQNAWWGKGVYSVHLPPDQWRDREQLLDNNFRNMMLRDLAAPEKGPEFVQQEYPKRAAFCVPILIDPADAYDISIRPTPEMEAAGKPPGRNLGDKLLNEPGKPQRCCVVLRVAGADGVKHAQGQLLDALRRRATASGDVVDKYRLGVVLTQRGLYHEALPILQDVLKIFESKEGPESGDTLAAMSNLAVLLKQMGRLGEAVELERRVLEAKKARFGAKARTTLNTMNNLANTLSHMGKYTEALELHQKALEIFTQTLWAEHPETLASMNNVALVLYSMGKYGEAAEMYQKVLKIKEKVLGPQHPSTLICLSNLGLTLMQMGKHGEAAELQRKVMEIMEKTLGAEHPLTLNSMCNLGMALTNLGSFTEAENLHLRALAGRERTLGANHSDTLESVGELAVTLHRKGDLNESLELQRSALSGREKILGHDHPDTQQSRQRLEEVSKDLGLKEAEVEKDGP